MSAGEITRAIDGLINSQFADDAWMLDGLCIDGNPEWWFPTPGDRKRTERAVAVCQVCPVRVRCLTYALETDSPYGIFGGQTEAQRKQIKENGDAA